MQSYQIRIVKDIKTFMELNYDDKFIYFDKSDFTTIYLMIIGPKGTPYEDGFLFFKVEFPINYPYSSPKVEFLNKDKRVRIHPNLYTCGKVCLSILGTWSGPAWKETMSLNTVALSIQSLLNENPLNNEPAWYNKTLSNNSCKDYYVFCTYNKYKLLINDVLDNKFKCSEYFKKEIDELFNKNKENLENNLLSYKNIYGKYILKNKPYSSMNNEYDFNNLILKKNEN